MQSADIATWLHLATFAPAGVFIWANRHLPGAIVMAAGGALNLTVIAANGGVMPARPAAWSAAGLPDVTDEVYANSLPTPDATLWVLGDVFYIPAGWPLANVFSIGDVLLSSDRRRLSHTQMVPPVRPDTAGSRHGHHRRRHASARPKCRSMQANSSSRRR